MSKKIKSIAGATLSVFLLSSSASYGYYSMPKNFISTYFSAGQGQKAYNVAGKSLSIDLKPNNISVAMIHPGWVQTDMGGENALISANESVTGTMKVISKMDLTARLLPRHKFTND